MTDKNNQNEKVEDKSTKELNNAIKKELIQSFGLAYQGFGLNKLMGHIVGLLLFSPKPLSLDDISEQLNMSKGPISQIARRLYDGNFIKKVWYPGSRKDYYEVNPEIFGNAFQYNMQLVHGNTLIAKKIKEGIEKSGSEHLLTLKKRMDEMEHFYRLMEKYFNDFMKVWIEERKGLYTD